MRNCEVCGKPTDGDRVYHEITGFEARRTQGGTNHVHLKKSTGRVAHVRCIEDKKSEVIPGQLSFA